MPASNLENWQAPFAHWVEGDLILDCHLQPKASRDAFVGQHGTRLKIAISAPPVDGKANAYLQKWLAQAFGVTKAEVHLITGAQGRQKRLRIQAPNRIPSALWALGECLSTS